MKMKKLGVLLLALLMVLGACTEKPAETPPGVIGQTGVLNLSMRTPPSLNPVEAPWESCKNTFSLIYDGLFCISDTMEVVPLLADSYSVLSEGLEVMIYLRSDVSWHDGTPFTAKDVIHTFDTIRSTENSAYATNLESVISWKKIDDYTVNIFLSEPYGTVVYDLTFPIIPAHFSDYTNTAIGTGPFTVSAYDAQKSMTLAPNQTYFGGAPKLSGVNVSFVRTDDMTAAAFSSHVADIVPASLQETASFSQDAAMNYISCPGMRLVFLGMNTQNELFSSALTRRAISSLVDRAAVAAEDYQGKAVGATSTIHPYSGSYNAEISDWTYSLDSARESLFAAGWSDLSGDGIIEIGLGEEQSEGNGERTSFVCTILTNEEDVLRTLVANRLATAMKEVGISATVEEVPFETYLERLSTGEYDCYLGKVEMKSPFDAGFLVGSGGASNFTGYKSEGVDRAIVSAMKAQDEISVKVSADEYQTCFAEEWPIVPICFLDSGWYAWNNVTFHQEGYQNPYNASHLWEIITPQE